MAVPSLLDTLFRRRMKKFAEFINIFEFEYDTRRIATLNFSNLVGRGGFGSVYKGMLQSGQEIAVKKMLSKREREFLNQVEILSKLRHKNLIQLLGFCSKQDHLFLVFEFMPNLSLGRFIFEPHRASELNWDVCRNIVQGVARGLRYLHEESGLRVVHCDIKPTNILLDSDFNSKIGGFDRVLMLQQPETELEFVAGTIGYLDPIYILTSHVLSKLMFMPLELSS